MLADKPSYKTNDPKGWCGDPKRGAAMGRPTIDDESADFSGIISLQKVRLDSGGYDPNGTYFGIGNPLYWYANVEGTIDGMLRAETRAQARAQVLAKYPQARVRK